MRHARPSQDSDLVPCTEAYLPAISAITKDSACKSPPASGAGSPSPGDLAATGAQVPTAPVATSQCSRCGMGFRVDEPNVKRFGQCHVTFARCSEPACGRRFWHGVHDGSGTVVVGVTPEDHAQWLAA